MGVGLNGGACEEVDGFVVFMGALMCDVPRSTSYHCLGLGAPQPYPKRHLA